MKGNDLAKSKKGMEGGGQKPPNNLTPEAESEALEMAKFYMISEKYNEAEKLLLNVLKQNPSNIEALYHLGLLYELTNRLDEAIKKFQNVLQLDPSNKEAEEHLHKLMEI